VLKIFLKLSNSLKNAHIALLVFAANFTFVGLTFADSQSTAQQTASYTKPYVLSPILNQPQSSTLGLSGSTGGGADCSKAPFGGQPSDGGAGGAGQSFLNSLLLPSLSIGSPIAPATTTLINIVTVGGTGGVGGNGHSCYSGYGGGAGGSGGNITFTTAAINATMQPAAIVVASTGGQGGDG
jgi:hypothetical protein